MLSTRGRSAVQPACHAKSDTALADWLDSSLASQLTMLQFVSAGEACEWSPPTRCSLTLAYEHKNWFKYNCRLWKSKGEKTPCNWPAEPLPDQPVQGKRQPEKLAANQHDGMGCFWSTFRHRQSGKHKLHPPIVEMNVELKASSENLNSTQVFPTPESPIKSSLNK